MKMRLTRTQTIMEGVFHGELRFELRREVSE